MRKQIIRLLIITSLFTGACRDADDAPMRTQDFQAPVVTGLYVTNDFVTVETWREPSSQGQIGVYYSVTNTNTRIRFLLQQTTEATVWITPAVLKGEELLNSTGGGLYAQIPGAAIKTFPKQTFPALLINDVNWDLKDDHGNKVRPGFYRVFIETGDDVLYTDMFVYNDCSDIPPDIKTEICN